MAKRPAAKKTKRISDHDFDAYDSDAARQEREAREVNRLHRVIGAMGEALAAEPLLKEALQRQERNTLALEKMADAFARLATYGAHLVNRLESELDADGTPKRAQPVVDDSHLEEKATKSYAAAEKATAEGRTDTAELMTRIADAHEAARIARRAGNMVEHHLQLELAQKLEAELNG